MSEDGDRNCPLCAEEMDYTDRHLKPCKCGYEICVWCWNHVMDMAEKDNKEGKCPACRTPYNKERIVAMAANCNRMVSRFNSVRKQNPQRAKSKELAAARQHLTGVRVVQRNLAYITGMPINLSDESLLGSKEYFGQYGKVLKVSISRPAGGTAQHTSRSKTFCVYVTYDREEEAIRCIQVVHNFMLEGRLLRACFGTAKYCRAWLRNVACSNPSCLYLHDMGSQEETFTKDEIISAYTRSRVPRIPSTYVHRRYGNILPPPIDDSSICVTSNKTIPKHATNVNSHNAMNPVQASNSHAENSTAVLPATAKWGLHASSCRPPVGSPTCSQTPTNKKGERNDSSSVNFSVVTTIDVSPWDDEDVITSSISEMNSLSGPSGPMKSGGRFRDCSTTMSDVSSEILQVEAFDASVWDEDNDEDVIVSSVSEMNNSSGPSGPMKSGNRRGRSTTVSDVEAFDDISWDDDIPISSNITEEKNMASAPQDQGTCMVVPVGNTSLVYNGHDTLRQGINSCPFEVHCNRTDDYGPIKALCSSLSSTSFSTDRYLTADHPNLDEHLCSTSNFASAGKAKNMPSDLDHCSSKNGFEELGTVPFTQASVLSSTQVSRELYNLSSSKPEVLITHAGDISRDKDFRQGTPLVNKDSWSISADKDMFSLREDESTLFTEDRSSSIFCKPEKVSELAEKNITGEKINFFGRFNGESKSDKSRNSDATDSSIISRILLLDSDPWDDSPSINGFLKLLGEANKRDDSHLMSTSRKLSIRNQSRFSFARQENHLNQLESLGEPPANSHKVVSSRGHTGLSRTKLSAPPGFSPKNKVPPPGFSFQENNLPTSLDNQYQVKQSDNMANVGFIDPGKNDGGRGKMPVGVRPRFPAEVTLEPDLRLPSHEQQYVPSHQSCRIPGHIEDIYLRSNVTHSVPQPVPQNFSSLSAFEHLSLHQPKSSLSLINNREGWNTETANKVAMLDNLRNERSRLNNYYPGNEDIKFHVPNADPYNRGFGM